MNATRTVGMLLFYKIDQMLFLGEGREIWARSVIDHEDGYVMNCFDHNKKTTIFHNDQIIVGAYRAPCALPSYAPDS